MFLWLVGSSKDFLIRKIISILINYYKQFLANTVIKFYIRADSVYIEVSQKDIRCFNANCNLKTIKERN